MPRFAPTHCAPGAARKRLPATLRTTHILDAAQTMCAMKARAFAPTDAVEAIVAAECLFQGGAYTRFDSKQDSVETLHPRGVASSLPLATRTSPCSPFNRSSQQHASDAGPIEPVRLFHQMPGHPDRVTSLHPKLTCGARAFSPAIRRSGHCIVAVP